MGLMQGVDEKGDPFRDQEGSDGNRVDFGGEFPGLKTTVFGHFWAVSAAYKRHTPLHIGLLSPQICTDLRGFKNPWKIGGNPPIGGKESTL